MKGGNDQYGYVQGRQWKHLTTKLDFRQKQWETMSK